MDSSNNSESDPLRTSEQLCSLVLSGSDSRTELNPFGLVHFIQSTRLRRLGVVSFVENVMRAG